MLHIGNERPKTILHEWMHNSLKQYLLNSLTHSFSQGELFYMLKYAQRGAINECNNKIDRKPFEDFGSKIWQYAYINFPTHFRLGNNLTDVTYADLANNTAWSTWLKHEKYYHRRAWACVSRFENICHVFYLNCIILFRPINLIWAQGDLWVSCIFLI